MDNVINGSYRKKLKLTVGWTIKFDSRNPIDQALFDTQLVLVGWKIMFKVVHAGCNCLFKDLVNCSFVSKPNLKNTKKCQKSSDTLSDTLRYGRLCLAQKLDIFTFQPIV